MASGPPEGGRVVADVCKVNKSIFKASFEAELRSGVVKHFQCKGNWVGHPLESQGQ